jgi:glycosyltransferase involved in cell wall biosynthesis
VRRYAEALTQRGDHVDVIALSKSGGSEGPAVIRGVTAYTAPCQQNIERHEWTYAWRLLRFLLASSLLLTRLHYRVRYDVIHVTGVPDCFVFAAWFPKWTGAKLILDINDSVPGLPKRIETVSAAFVDHVIVPNPLGHESLNSRSASKCSVFLNQVDPENFHRRLRTRGDNTFLILSFVPSQCHEELEIAIKAWARLKDRLPNADLHIYGGTCGDGAEGRISALADEVGVVGSIKFFRMVSPDKVPDIIANADLGVVFKRADSFGNEAYRTQLIEFMSQGVPVVASRPKSDSFCVDDAVVRSFPSRDDRAMAEAMVEIAEDKALRDALIARGYEYVNRNSWDSRKRDYLELVDSLSVEQF